MPGYCVKQDLRHEWVRSGGNEGRILGSVIFVSFHLILPRPADDPLTGSGKEREQT